MVTAALVVGIASRSRSVFTRATSTGVISGIFLVTSLGQYTAWFVTRQHETLKASRWLSSQVGENVVVAGDWAPNLGLARHCGYLRFSKGLQMTSHQSSRWVSIMC